jgi:hypothetical protein
MKRALLSLLAISLFALASGAAAQLRAIPKEAKLGVIRYVEATRVEVNGEPRPLAPGVQIRDADNRLVLSASLQERLKDYEDVLYMLDGAGAVSRVWLLSDPEKAALPRPPSPYPR